ncbi:putative sporulation transcription regulator WhiA [Clostridium sp. CAG:273]|nr:DNA-binding protein WhiA [Clostridia bacterium]CDE84010.1 putative sporulation transcription regulator WhiA [Clostridium sp. CAG:273]
MSFSSDVKEELSKISNLPNKDEVKAELIGYLLTSNIDIQKQTLRYSTESQYNINRFGKLLSNLGYIDYKIEIQGKVYSITVKQLEMDEINYKENNIYLATLDKIFNKENLEKALVRGCFMGSGSINNPKNKYHMEILFSLEKNAKFILEILNKYNIEFKILENNSTLYSKDGEEISKFLAFIGANFSVLKFEDIRVFREMRNNVNRLVNCETANINKIATAAAKQIAAINKIKKMGKFDSLPDNLKEIAEVREKNPDMSLLELGKLLQTPIGKSGVNHRLKAIEKIAEE